MINRAQEIMKEQEVKMMEIERELQTQREGEAIKLVAEVREAVQILKCEYLLNGSEDDSRVKDLEAKLVVANNNIEALTKKCKEIGPLKSKVTKAEKAKEDAIKAKKEAEKEVSELTKKLETISKTAATWQSKYDAITKELKDVKANASSTDNKEMLLTAIKMKDKYIVELEQQLSDKAYQAANDGYVVDGLEVSVAVVEDLNNTINEMQEELAKQDKEIEELKEIIKGYKSAKNNNVVVEEQPKTFEQKEVKVEESIQENVSDKFELNPHVKFKSGTKLYESNDHYVLAKENIKELVVVPKSFNVEVKSEDAVKYENLLVSQFKFNANRQAISPVTVELQNATHKAVLVRTKAADSLYQFSYKDILAGYIVSQYKVYFWSWDLKHEQPYFLDLGQKAKGKARCEVSAGDRKALSNTVKQMVAEYNEKVKVYAEAHKLYNVTKEEAIKSQNSVKDRISSLFNYDKETKEIEESAQKPQVVIQQSNNKDDASKKDNVSQKGYSTSLNDFVSEMFS